MGKGISPAIAVVGCVTLFVLAALLFVGLTRDDATATDDAAKQLAESRHRTELKARSDLGLEFLGILQRLCPDPNTDVFRNVTPEVRGAADRLIRLAQLHSDDEYQDTDSWSPVYRLYEASAATRCNPPLSKRLRTEASALEDAMRVRS